MKKSDQQLSILYLIIDLLLVNLSITVSLFVKYGIQSFNPKYQVFYIGYNLVWLFVAIFKKSYLTHWRNRFYQVLQSQIVTFFYHMGIISFFVLVYKDLDFSRQAIYGAVLLFFILKIIIGTLIFKFVGRLRKSGKNLRNVLILGAGRVGQHLAEFFENHPHLGYAVLGFLDDNHKENKDINVLGEINDLEKILTANKVDEMIVALPLHHQRKIKETLKKADFFGIRTRLIPDYFHLLGRNYHVRFLGEMPVINIREIPLDDIINYSAKRLFDILFSAITLIILLPVYLVISLVILIESKKPLFYAPIRVGMHGKKFRLYKFRTMYRNDDEENGIESTKKDDSRITKVGQFLRKHSLDELPQFWNVLRGDMSVVGPRPHRIWLNKQMQDTIFCYMVRHYLRPGITGWAQVNGWRGLIDNEEHMQKRTEHDLWYMENWSLWLDIRIIWLTLFSKKVRQNAF